VLSQWAWALILFYRKKDIYPAGIPASILPGYSKADLKEACIGPFCLCPVQPEAFCVSNVNYFVRSASIILAGFSHIDN
jgi:hypothetical protein